MDGNDDGGTHAHTDLIEINAYIFNKKRGNTDESAIAVHRGGQPPGVLQRGHLGVQRRRAALHAHVVARAETVARAGEEQRRADGNAALGAAAFGLVERDGEAVIVVDRVVRCRGGGGGRRRRRRYDGGLCPRVRRRGRYRR